MLPLICLISIACLGQTLSADKVTLNFDLIRGDPLSTTNEFKAQIKLALDSVYLVRNNLNGDQFPNLETPIQLDEAIFKIWHNNGGRRDELYYTTPRRVFTSPLTSIGYSIELESSAVLSSGFYPSRVIYNPGVYNKEKEREFQSAESDAILAKLNEQLLSTVLKNKDGQTALEVVGQLEKKLSADRAQREKKEQDRKDEEIRLHENGLKAVEEGTAALYKVVKGDKLPGGNFAVKLVLENQNAKTVKFPSVVEPNANTYHTDDFDDSEWFVIDTPGQEDLTDLETAYYVHNNGYSKNAKSGFYSLYKGMTNYLRDLYHEPFVSANLLP